jgi:hypothetical protein
MPRVLLAAYRRTGADLPWGDPVRAHGVTMEGWFWRFTDRAAGRVVVALLGISRAPDGSSWGTVALGGHPGGFVARLAAGRAWADPDGRGLRAIHEGREVLRAARGEVAVDLGPGARLRAVLRDPFAWPAGAMFGGVGPAHAVPALSQYWHPAVLHARAEVDAELGSEHVVLAQASAYHEKNWGAGGFPPAWWWGQSHGFDREDVCVAFAGGRAGLGPLQATATSLVVRVGEEVVRIVRPLQPMAVDVGPAGFRLRGRTARWTVAVEADPAGTEPHGLPVPLPAERRNLEGGARQHLAARLRFTVTRRGATVFRGESVLAGLERGTSEELPAA